MVECPDYNKRLNRAECAVGESAVRPQVAQGSSTAF